MPSVMVPAIVALFFLERRAHRQGLINIAAAQRGLEEDDVTRVEIAPKQPFWTVCVNVFHELDTVGLVLLGFGWSLVRPRGLLVPKNRN